MGIRCADHVTSLYPQKLALTSSTGGGRSVGIVSSRTKATVFFFLRTNKTILTKADKGKSIIVMIEDKYEVKMNKFLCEAIYKKETRTARLA